MVGVCLHVHLSHISGHFPSNILFLCISEHFRSIFGEISAQMHYFRASQCIFVQCGNTHMEDISEIHIGKFLENTYRGFFFRISIGGICVIDGERDAA